MADYLPDIGGSGTYTLASPFNSKINARVSYTCGKIASIKALVAEGRDVSTEIYTANGLTASDYINALDNDVKIITIISGTGSEIEFPSSHMLSYPNASGIQYRTCVIGITVSAIPDTLDITPLITELNQTIEASLGVPVAAKLITLSPPQLVSQSDHAKITAARATKKSTSETLHAKVTRLTAELAKANQKVTALESALIAKASQ